MPNYKKSLSAGMKASTFGAGVLGLGLGALLSGYLQSYSLPLVLIGASMHGWGMYSMHAAKPKMSILDKILYWGCWIALTGLAAYVAIGLVA